MFNILLFNIAVKSAIEKTQKSTVSGAKYIYIYKLKKYIF